MKSKLGLIGALGGFGLGIGLMVFVVVTGGVPGTYELLVQLAIACIFAGVFGSIGFTMGCVADLCSKKPTEQVESKAE